MSQTQSFQYALPANPDGTQKTVTFRQPLSSDRQDVLRMIPPDDRRTSADEMLAAYCLLEVNGVPLKNPDPRTRIRDWTTKEQQVYTNYFLWMFFADDAEMEKVRADAKNAMSGAFTEITT